MNKENASKLWKIIQEAGDYLLHYRQALPSTTPHYFTLVSTSLCRYIKNNIVKTKNDKQKTRGWTRDF